MLFPFVESVVIPVMIPFKYPVNDEVEPAPGNVTEVRVVVIPYPTIAPRPARLVVEIPII